MDEVGGAVALFVGNVGLGVDIPTVGETHIQVPVWSQQLIAQVDAQIRIYWGEGVVAVCPVLKTGSDAGRHVGGELIADELGDARNGDVAFEFPFVNLNGTNSLQKNGTGDVGGACHFGSRNVPLLCLGS